MAKKKLFGNRKEPRCETCANGKLSPSGESVLCVHGGALPLSHSCRRYQYDPLRRVPKRRPLLGEYSAADFALDEQIASDISADSPLASDAPADTSVPSRAETEASDRSTFDHLFAYLDGHDTPDADTIRAILNKTYRPDEESLQDPDAEKEKDTRDQVKKQADQEAVLSPDNSPDIFRDLERLDMAVVPDFALMPLDKDGEQDIGPLFLSGDTAEDVVFFADASNGEDAPLNADDLLFLPKGTASDHDGEDNVGVGFTPLTADE